VGGAGRGPRQKTAGAPALRIAARPAGSLILFNAADIWHSGTFNYSPGPRLAVTANFDPRRGAG
jgi:hypothetical protein